MTPGDLWVAHAPQVYLTKPRPVLIVQNLDLIAAQSVIVCLVTSVPLAIPLVRISIPEWSASGLTSPSFVMVEKLAAVPVANLARRVGNLSEGTMNDVKDSLRLLLDME